MIFDDEKMNELKEMHKTSPTAAFEFLLLDLNRLERKIDMNYSMLREEIRRVEQLKNS